MERRAGQRLRPSDIRQNSLPGLLQQAEDAAGRWAPLMPTPKCYGPHTEWTADELSTLKIFSNSLTSAEIAIMLGRSRGAVQQQAMRLGIQLLSDHTTTAFGRQAEQFALTLLNGGIKQDYHAPYDIEWHSSKINVKATRLRYNKPARCWYWHFRIKDTWQNCDCFLFLGYLDDDMPVRAWLVPNELCNKSSVGISQNGHKHMFNPYEIEVNNSCEYYTQEICI